VVKHSWSTLCQLDSICLQGRTNLDTEIYKKINENKTNIFSGVNTLFIVKMPKFFLTISLVKREEEDKFLA